MVTMTMQILEQKISIIIVKDKANYNEKRQIMKR